MPTYLSVDKDTAAMIAMCAYLGERCKFCGKVFETLNDLHDVVWAGYHKHGRLAHRECWETHKSQEGDKHPCQPTS